jgi:hypothetical protein
MGVVVGVLFLAAAVVGAVLYRHYHSPSDSAEQDASSQSSTANPAPDADELSAAVVKPGSVSAPPRTKAYAVPSRSAPAPAPVPANPTGAAAAALPPESAHAQQLLQRLSQLDSNQSKITPEQAAAFRQNLKELATQGAAALPAIRQFLEKNQDLAFDGDATSQIGYSSLRAGLFDTLRQIGGPEATDVFLGTLRGTADPSEIALIARYLDEQEPGQHRQEIVSAARETLEQTAAGQLQAKEVGPLFQVFQKYGDANSVADLEKALPQWQYYATMALAGLPEGQGISALTQRAQANAATGKSANTFALQMLAQMSAQYPDAASALVEQARQNQIPDRVWTKIVEGLAGDQYQIGKAPTDTANPNSPPAGLKTYHIESGNQNFYSLPFNLYGSAEQAAQRRALVDQLMNATQNPAAQQALQNARAVLSAPTP